MLPPWRKQASILADRYLGVMLGDLGTVFLLLAQAAVLGGLCIVVWGGVEQDTKNLYFVLALIAVWLGCINASREIVKERAVFERERLWGLSPLAYVVSKVRILVALDVVQVALLLGLVEWQIGLRGSLVWQALSLTLCAVAGTGLGLLVSALSKRQARAVAAVPLLIIPQILFSEFAIPRQQFSRVTEILEDLMIARWGYDVFVQGAAISPKYWDIALALGVLVGMAALLCLLTVTVLKYSRSQQFL